MDIQLDVKDPEDNCIFKIACLTSVGKYVMLKIFEKKTQPTLFSHTNISDYFLAI